MRVRQLNWKWLLLGIAVLVLIFIPCIPLLVGDTSQFSGRVAAELSKWSGGKVELTGPVHVRYFPEVSVRSQFKLSGGSRLPLVESITAREAKISLDLADLLLGRIKIDALRLLKPRIVLAGASSAAPRDLVDRLFAAGAVRVIHVRDGTLQFRSAAGGQIVRDIDAHFDGSDGGGAVSSSGSFSWRNETIRFSFDSSSLSKSADGSVLPVTFTVTSSPFKAEVSGKATFGTSFALEGDMQAEIGNVRRLLSWFGTPLPDGQSLRGLTAAGAFHLNGSTLTFDDGNFTLDGNSAVGLLAVSAGTRPRVEGTLAFDRLVLDPYLGPLPASDGTPTSAGPASSLFDWALLKYFDADLRISAGTIYAGALKLGHGGFTISAKQGQLVSEISELEVCGGSAAGRVGADLSQPNKRLSLVASLADVSLETCLEPFALTLPLAGVGGVKADLTAEGQTMPDLLRNLTGSLKLNARSGMVPVDFAKLITSAAPLEGEGWSSRATSFDQLNADCRLAAGHIWCQMINMHTARNTASGTADVDLPKETLDVSLSVTNPITTANASPSDDDPPKVSIEGPLLLPTIRRADHPSLGEDNSQPSSLATPASPH